MADSKNKVHHPYPPSGGFFFYGEQKMEIIKLNKNHRFIIETNKISEEQLHEIKDEWNKLFPNNPLICVPKESLTIVEIS